ncbi:MAG: hypothetical protein ABH950_07075 [Candidatus Altiarchaeota archaeon]
MPHIKDWNLGLRRRSVARDLGKHAVPPLMDVEVIDSEKGFYLRDLRRNPKLKGFQDDELMPLVSVQVKATALKEQLRSEGVDLAEVLLLKKAFSKVKRASVEAEVRSEVTESTIREYVVEEALEVSLFESIIQSAKTNGMPVKDFVDGLPKKYVKRFERKKQKKPKMDVLSTTNRKKPKILVDVDLDANAHHIIKDTKRIFWRGEASKLAPEQADTYRSLLDDYFKEERLIHHIIGIDPTKRYLKLFNFLFGEKPGCLFSLKKLGGKKDNVTMGDSLIQLLDGGGHDFTIDRLIGSDEFVFTTLKSGGIHKVDRLETDEFEGGTIVLKPNAALIENLIALNVDDSVNLGRRFWSEGMEDTFQDRMKRLTGGTSPFIKIDERLRGELPSRLTLAYVQNEMLPLEGLNTVRKELAVLGFGREPTWYPSPIWPRQVMIPEGVGPEFIDKIVLKTGPYNATSEYIDGKFKGEYRIGGRDWRDVIVTHEEYHKSTRMERAIETSRRIKEFEESAR